MTRGFLWLCYAILILAACGEGTGPRSAQIQFLASNGTPDSLIVWWWWKDVRSEDVPGNPITFPPRETAPRCITFTAVGWAQIDAAQGTHDRNSSAGDWRGNLVTIDPVRASYWRIRAGGPGQPPTVIEEPSAVC